MSSTAVASEPWLLPSKRARLRVLHAAGSVVHASSGLDLRRSDDAGATFRRIARAGGSTADRALARTPIASRLLRAGFHGLTPLPNGDMVAIVRGAVLHCAAGSNRFEVAHRITRGTRPLNVCLAPSGRLFFGEYFGNASREDVHVYASDDGRSWDVAWTFPAGSIRHVHGIHSDPFRGGIWILTGDDDDESGIFWSGDDMKTLDPVVHGSQSARAVIVLPTPEGLVIPTDTPREQNHIQFLDVGTERLERLCPVPGSVFTGGRTKRLYLLSTTVEPSDVNVDSRVAFLASADGREWKTVTRFGRDMRLLNDRKGRLQYPMLRFPDGVLDGGLVLATGQSIAGAHDRLLGWCEGEILGRLQEKD